MASYTKFKKIDYQNIKAVALQNIDGILSSFLPHGIIKGTEYCVSNPKRTDNDPSLFINIRTGHWGDFVIDRTGGDLISLVAYVKDLKQWEAAKLIAERCGVSAYER